MIYFLLPSSEPPAPNIEEPTSTSEPQDLPAIDTVNNDVQRFITNTQYNPSLNGFIVSASLRNGDADTLELIMNDNWHSLPSSVRQQRAEGILRAWNMAHTPKSGNFCWITLRDSFGNEVGGQTTLGEVWVAP